MARENEEQRDIKAIQQRFSMFKFMVRPERLKRVMADADSIVRRGNNDETILRQRDQQSRGRPNSRI